MAQDAWVYKNVDGECAFLAGALDVLTDQLSMSVALAGLKYDDLASEVYFIGENNEIDINTAIKLRMRTNWNGSYYPEEVYDEQKLIDKLDLCLELKDVTIEAGIFGIFEHDRGFDFDKEVLMKEVQTYCNEIMYYLGKTKAIYYATGESLKTADAIEKCYMGIIYDIVFIEFEAYMLMLVHGTSE